MRAGPCDLILGGIGNSVSGRPVGPRTGVSIPGSSVTSSRCAVMRRVYGGPFGGPGGALRVKVEGYTM